MRYTSPTRTAIATLTSVIVATGANAETGYFSVLQRCPRTCSTSGQSPSNWTVYHDLSRFAYCSSPMLLDLAIHNAIDDPNTHSTFRACSSDDANTNVTIPGSPEECAPGIETRVAVQTATSGIGSASSATDMIIAAQQAQSYFAGGNCNATTSLGYFNGTVVGVYAGPKVHNQGAVNLIQHFVTGIQTTSSTNSYQLMQICGEDHTGNYVLGVVAATVGSLTDIAALASVQTALKSWSNGECITGFDASSSSWSNKTIWQTGQLSISNTTSFFNSSTASIARRSRIEHITKRDDCSTIQVVSGDSCGTLASECGISAADFTTYNPSSTLCSSLAVGEYVCCSAGTLPDRSPQQQPDGTCATYLVQSGDSCSTIAAANSVTIDEVESWNSQTWGWMGCDDLQAAMIMCLSTGSAPMPATVANAICGPQVVGTTAPTGDETLADLNPCPLNACCDVWGQCGTTDDFCTATNSSTGAPGTAKAGTNGCISNCGTDIVNNSDAPSSFIRLAYFESWSGQRPCLNMDVRTLGAYDYTHVHFAFANITDDFDVDVSAVQDDFNYFAAMTGQKKILSFGGWSFSTSQDSYPIFRSGVTDAQRLIFANNFVNFAAQYGIDGVDFDWEYPGAPDIPGIPPGSPEDGSNYLAFLKTLKGLLPSDKSISFAAPASFWYLKGFPIANMSDVADYIVYMTYDLHGQWDYGSTFSNPGCPTGNCLRSHVNLTETTNSLSMITKAGVPAAKIVVGVASYGRSFQMTDPTCTGVECTFTGPLSGASRGECSQTAGYIFNAELNDIVASGNGTTSSDDDSDSDIIIYNGNWVAYMSDARKSSRQGLYQGLNFAGTTDWAG